MHCQWLRELLEARGENRADGVGPSRPPRGTVDEAVQHRRVLQAQRLAGLPCPLPHLESGSSASSRSQAAAAAPGPRWWVQTPPARRAAVAAAPAPQLGTARPEAAPPRSRLQQRLASFLACRGPGQPPACWAVGGGRLGALRGNRPGPAQIGSGQHAAGGAVRWAGANETQVLPTRPT